MADKQSRLTEKQELFIKYYLENGRNAPRALVQVRGYGDPSDHRVKVMAYRWLRKPFIAEVIEKANKSVAVRTERILEKYGASRERVIEELAKIAFTDFSDLHTWDKDGIQGKASDEIPETAKGAIADVSVDSKKGKIKIKTLDKQQALLGLGKALGIFEHTQKHEHKHAHVTFVIEKE